MDKDKFICLLILLLINILLTIACFGGISQIDRKVDQIEPVVVTRYVTATPDDAETATVDDAELSIEVNEVELHHSVWHPPTEVYEAQIYQIRLANGSVEEIIEENKNGSYIGSYELTAYIATGNPCADGVYPQTGYTAASNNPNLWHKWIHIEGYGDYYIHDRGGMPSDVIDIYVGSYGEAIQFGRRTAEVYIKE